MGISSCGIGFLFIFLGGGDWFYCSYSFSNDLL